MPPRREPTPPLVRHSLGVLALLCLASVASAAEPPRILGARLGVGDHYKLGFWAPLTVSVEGGDAPMAVTVVAVAPDNDGVAAATTAAGRRPISAEPGRVSEDRLYVRVGQWDAPIEVRLMDGGRTLHRKLISVDHGADPEAIAAGEALNPPTDATARLLLVAGPECGAAAALVEAEEQRGWSDSAAARVEQIKELPRDAIGYEGVDAVVLVAGRQGGWLNGLTAGDPRVAALVEWVESGGRLVFSCGSGADDLIASGGPLATLAPGDYAGRGTLRQTAEIESFAEADDREVGSIDLAGGTLPTAQLEGVAGRVVARAGRGEAAAPLVVRTPRGFGEVTFVAFDLDATPLGAWPGRAALLRQLLRLENAAATNDGGWNGSYGFGEDDLIGRLINRLDSQFTGVTTTPFMAIVGLVLLYLLLIGPGDYYLVTRVLKRPEATWVTFPLIVLATGAAAYAGAYWLKGSQLRVNQVEVVDIDSATGDARGMVLTHLFSPRADRYDLGLVARAPSGETVEPTALQTAWLGKPGSGLGGMRRPGAFNRTGWRPNYTIDPAPSLSGEGAAPPALRGVPVQVWSTKTFVSRWRGAVERRVEAELTPTGDGLVTGLVTNDTGAELADCRLLYGSWAWRLGKLLDGQTAEIDDSTAPVKINTLLTGYAQRTDDPRRQRLVTDGPDDVDSMAEHLSAGGRLNQQNGRPASAYFSSSDLTHLLDDGRALLLAKVADAPRSELLRDGESLVDDDNNYWVFVRYILKVDGGGGKAE